ncbi:hypothetical protein [Xanthomonas fragariae]|uniref:hypothetical protein n=1 Tax=Xanthomonas fragariae TaxID=48664 RepID=UPI0022AA5C82|nr:hypothetical protein [Xanthomonas fragariae]WAT16679.1 hypothetical protein OZ429_05600 [Xanthomonas fragariae]
MSKSLFKDFSNYRIIVEMRTRYHSDINREQFDQIRALLEGARKKTAPRIADAQSVKNTDTATH